MSEKAMTQRMKRQKPCELKGREGREKPLRFFLRTGFFCSAAFLTFFRTFPLSAVEEAPEERRFGS